jgi:hypothetical protein
MAMKQNKWVRKLIGVAVVAGGSGLLPASACNGTIGQEFRAVAGDSIQQGVQSIVSGMLDGVFAVMEPDSTGTS